MKLFDSHAHLASERFAEDLKISIGSAFPRGLKENRYMEMRGRDLVNGLPKSIRLSTMECCEALQEPLAAIVAAVKEVLEHMPPELSADIMDRGIVLTGGGALLHGLDVRLNYETGLPVRIAEDPVSCVARGTGKALSQLHLLRNTSAFAKRAL